MSSISVVLVLSALIGHAVFADETTRGMSVDGLPHESATTNLWDADKVGFIQTEIVSQTAKSKAETSDSIVDEDGGGKEGHICQELSSSLTPEMSCAPVIQENMPKAFPKSDVLPIADSLGDDLLDEKTFQKKTEVDAETPSTRSTAGSVLAWCLDILVLLFIVDGIRRWCHKDTSTSNKCSVDNWQAFMQAALVGDTARCEALLVDGVDVTRTDVWGCTLLHAAAKSGSVRIMNQLLKHGGKVTDLDSWDETPLHLAARAGHTDVCELLLAKGSPIDALNAQDWTPLVTAAYDAREATCRLLLSHGATVGGLADSELPPMLTGLLLERMVKKEQPPSGLEDSLLWKLDEEDDYAKLMKEDDIDAAATQCHGLSDDQ